MVLLFSLKKRKLEYSIINLGYPAATTYQASIQLGVPRMAQPMFLVTLQVERIPDAAVGIVRGYLAKLDEIEERLFGTLDRFQAKELGEITLNPDEPDMLEREYARWARRLADILGVPINIYAERLRGGFGGSRPLNVKVR